jgi:hypothetical protein
MYIFVYIAGACKIAICQLKSTSCSLPLGSLLSSCFQYSHQECKFGQCSLHHSVFHRLKPNLGGSQRPNIRFQLSAGGKYWQKVAIWGLSIPDPILLILTMCYNMSGFVEGYYVFYISPMENLFWGDPLIPSIHFGGFLEQRGATFLPCWRTSMHSSVTSSKLKAGKAGHWEMRLSEVIFHRETQGLG